MSKAVSMAKGKGLALADHHEPADKQGRAKRSIGTSQRAPRSISPVALVVAATQAHVPESQSSRDRPAHKPGQRPEPQARLTGLTGRPESQD